MRTPRKRDDRRCAASCRLTPYHVMCVDCRVRFVPARPASLRHPPSPVEFPVARSGPPAVPCTLAVPRAYEDFEFLLKSTPPQVSRKSAVARIAIASRARLVCCAHWSLLELRTDTYVRCKTFDQIGDTCVWLCVSLTVEERTGLEGARQATTIMPYCLWRSCSSSTRNRVHSSSTKRQMMLSTSEWPASVRR